MVKASSQYDTTWAMWGVECARVCRNRLGFYFCVSCIHVLRRIVKQPLHCARIVRLSWSTSVS